MASETGSTGGSTMAFPETESYCFRNEEMGLGDWDSHFPDYLCNSSPSAEDTNIWGKKSIKKEKKMIYNSHLKLIHKQNSQGFNFLAK